MRPRAGGAGTVACCFAVRAFALLITVVWLAASVTYALRGYKTKKEAVTLLEDEREGRYIPETVKAEPLLPKTLEERLLAIAGQEGPIAEVGASADASTPPPPPPPPPIGAPGARETSPDAQPIPDAQAAASLGSIFDAPAPPPPRPAGSGATTVAEALAGIEVPCDLVPLVAADNPVIDPMRVPFMTRGVAPTAVAIALRDALVGGGYEFQSTGPMTAIASRGHTTLSVQVHDAPSTVIVGTEKRFPSATIDSVVVEIASV